LFHSSEQQRGALILPRQFDVPLPVVRIATVNRKFCLNLKCPEPHVAAPKKQNAASQGGVWRNGVAITS
jgi:hypothetical protein